MKSNLVVVFGGNSVEHEISIITALQAIENINQDKYKVYPVYMSKDGEFYFDESFTDINIFKDMNNIKDKYKVVFNKNQNEVSLAFAKKSLFNSKPITTIDMVFPIVHGTNVEDGKLQGFFNTLDVPVIGTTTVSGVVGQDKAIMKDILAAHNISQTKYKWYLDSDDREEVISDILNTFGPNVIIKPAELGSSIGISVAKSEEMLRNALNDAYTFSPKVVVEALLEDFTEVNISVVGNYKKHRLSVTEQVVKNDEILSYEDKYLSGGGKKSGSKSSGMASLSRIIPANIDQKLITEIEAIASTTFRVLNCSGVIRLDLMIVGDQVYVNEVNNIPGSLAYYLWQATDLEYAELLDLVINSSIDLYFEQSKFTSSISTNVLANVGSIKK